MAGQQLKDLVRAYRRRDDTAFRAAVEQIIDEETAKKHTALAAELRRLLGYTTETLRMQEMPIDRDSRLPLAHLRDPERAFRKLTLPDAVQKQLARVVIEARRWPELEATALPRRNKLLLSGPPGCGKTTSAEALAHQLGRPLIIARMQGLMNSHLGNTRENISQLFAFASAGEYVLLLDEFDSIGQSRGTDDVGEMRRVTNTVLQLIEQHTGPTVIVAATNHTVALDSALWRRFDIVAELPLPDAPQIRDLLRRLVPAELITDQLLEQLDGYPHAAAEHLGQAALREAILDSRDEPEAKDVAAAVAETVGRPWS